MGGRVPRPGPDGGYLGQVQMGGYPSQVWMGGAHQQRMGYPPHLDLGWGTPPWLGQQKAYSLRGGRYASCVHAGGLSCYFITLLMICLLMSRCPAIPLSQWGSTAVPLNLPMWGGGEPLAQPIVGPTDPPPPLQNLFPPMRDC